MTVRRTSETLYTTYEQMSKLHCAAEVRSICAAEAGIICAVEVRILLTVKATQIMYRSRRLRDLSLETRAVTDG
jgi:hypothetical protein